MFYLAVALALVFSLAAAMVPAGPVSAQTTLQVNATTGIIHTGDPCPVPRDGAVYADIQAAIACSLDGDTIIVAAGTYFENGINIDKSLTIQGAGPGTTIVDGGGGGGVFSVGQFTVVMSGMTIRNGWAAYGGGVFNVFGDLTMINCTVADNGGATYGGGIGNYGTLKMIDCTVGPNNTATDEGGGIINEGGDVTLTNCTISGNTVSGSGVGIGGGGIYNKGGTVTLTNCTVSDNHADNGQGGGIYIDGGRVELKCTIVYDNTAGVSGDDVSNYGTYSAHDSIVGPPYGYLDPLLGLLKNNGGPTNTHALLYGSPAIDGCIHNCNVDTDQRGLPRPIDGNYDGIPYCDVGAYEKQSPAPVGGIVEPVDRFGILAPWLALAALMAAAIAVMAVVRKHRTA